MVGTFMERHQARVCYGSGGGGGGGGMSMSTAVGLMSGGKSNPRGYSSMSWGQVACVGLATIGRSGPDGMGGDVASIDRACGTNMSGTNR